MRCPLLFVPGGQTFLTHRRKGEGQTFLTHRGGDKHFYIEGGQKNFVGGSVGFDDVEEEIDVSEANIFVSGAECLYN